MEKRVIYTDENQRELLRPLDSRFLVMIEHEDISDFILKRVAVHWHPEFELALVTRGQLLCHAGSRSFLLKAGEGVFFNSNCLHGYSDGGDGGCLYEALLFSPRFFGEPGTVLYDKYVAPVMLSPGFNGFKLSPSVPWQKQFFETALQITDMEREKPPHRELRTAERLFFLWRLLWENAMDSPEGLPGADRDTARMKEAMTYIQSSFRSPITLASIASACSLSQSECCRLFRRFLHQSPIDYVISCRITAAMSMLAKGGFSMTEIAEQTGFQSSSYFSETFKRLTGMTPSAYKKINSKNS